MELGIAIIIGFIPGLLAGVMLAKGGINIKVTNAMEYGPIYAALLARNTEEQKEETDIQKEIRESAKAILEEFGGDLTDE